MLSLWPSTLHLGFNKVVVQWVPVSGLGGEGESSLLEEAMVEGVYNQRPEWILMYELRERVLA